jgi:hypothetical protein
MSHFLLFQGFFHAVALKKHSTSQFPARSRRARVKIAKPAAPDDGDAVRDAMVQAAADQS